MAEVEDFNAPIIEEFRANGGKVGGQFAGAPLLLLHSTGARSGRDRVNPVVYQRVRDGYAVFASKAGAPTNPDWYHNLLANPQAAVEVGSDTIAVTASEATGSERAAIWEKQVADFPFFADYQAKTSRQIPVMVLTPVPETDR